jgi:5'-nucleotidase
MTKRILVTNDDGIDSPGLHAVVEALAEVAHVSVIAPNRNRSAVSRSITLGSTLQVMEHEVPGAELAFATDGTPTDCVRFAALGLVGDVPDLIVSGANQGLNLGDDVTYSGPVAAAFEGVINGIPGIAVSQQSLHRELGFPKLREFDYTTMQLFVRHLIAGMLPRLGEVPRDLVLSVNVPGLAPMDVRGVEVTGLGRRIYRDKLELQREEGGQRHYTIYGDDPSHHEEEGTDIAAIGRDCIAVTPLRFQLLDESAVGMVQEWKLESFLDELRRDDAHLWGSTQ